MQLNKIFKISILILLFIPILVYSEPIREYKLTLNTQFMEKDSLEIEIKDYSDYQSNLRGDYIWAITSNNVWLNYSHFDIYEEILVDIVNPETGEIDDGGLFIKELESIELFIPYYENADKIIIFKQNQINFTLEKIKEINILRYANLNKIDFVEKENFVENHRDPNPPFNEQLVNEIKEENKNQYIYYFLFILILLIVFILIKKIKKSKS